MKKMRAVSYIMMTIGCFVWYASLFPMWPTFSILPKSMFSKEELKAAKIAEMTGCAGLICASIGFVILIIID